MELMALLIDDICMMKNVIGLTHMEETWEIKGSYMGEARRKDVSRSTDKAIVSSKSSDIFDRKCFQLERA